MVGTLNVAAGKVPKIPDPLFGVGGFADEFERRELGRVNRKIGFYIVADDR